MLIKYKKLNSTNSKCRMSLFSLLLKLIRKDKKKLIYNSQSLGKNTHEYFEDHLEKVTLT